MWAGDSEMRQCRLIIGKDDERYPSIRHTDHEMGAEYGKPCVGDKAYVPDQRLRRRGVLRWGMKQQSGVVAMKDGSQWGTWPAAFIKMERNDMAEKCPSCKKGRMIEMPSKVGMPWAKCNRCGYKIYRDAKKGMKYDKETTKASSQKAIQAWDSQTAR